MSKTSNGIDYSHPDLGPWEAARLCRGYPKHPELDYNKFADPWSEVLPILDSSNDKGRIQVWENWRSCRTDGDELQGVLFSFEPDSPMPGSEDRTIKQGDNLCPPLPAYAQLSPDQISASTDAGHWLDEYMNFATYASPLTPESFHIAAGLFVAGLAIARRLHLKVSTKANTIFPNLYMLFVGHSTRPRKSTALRVLRGLLEEAGMMTFLLADRQTPEALSLDLTTQIPSQFNSWPANKKTLWLQQRPIASQRGWLLEEASHLLDSFKRDYSAGLLPMVLDMYDSADHGPSRNTITRGWEKVDRPYINIFGATTYGAMTKHIAVPEHWHNGLFARFALVGSDNTGAWHFWPPPHKYPPDLIRKLHFIAYELLPMPEAKIIDVEGDKGDHAKSLIEVEVDPPLKSFEVSIESDAWNAWERYSKAVTFDMLPEQPSIVPANFYASYGRLGTMMIKVAMILASLDARGHPISIEPRHIYRAQSIVEGWRVSLHSIMAKVGEVIHGDIAEKIKSILAGNGTNWTTRRDLCRALNVRWSDIESAIIDLESSDEIERQDYIPKRGKSSEEYRICTD